MPAVQVDQWPFKALKVDVDSRKGQTRTLFLPKTVIIDRVVSGTGKNGPYTAWVFAGDTTQVISQKDGKTYKGATWWAEGPWDEGTQARLSYNGPSFAKGQEVDVELVFREWTGDDGKQAKGYSVTRIQAAPPVAKDVEDLLWDGDKDAPEAQKAIAQSERTKQATDYDDREARTRESIEQQTAFKGYAEVVVALLGAKTPPAWITDSGTLGVVEVFEHFIKLGATLSHLPPTPAKPEEPDGEARPN